ncbi:MAG: PQQ-dependent sugar dehydrogenase [Anaerolineaceae bacterium]|nr:PQQ-dependent sugar dehydrogenase [Anaerolineaceae bacterium]
MKTHWIIALGVLYAISACSQINQTAQVTDSLPPTVEPTQIVITPTLTVPVEVTNAVVPTVVATNRQTDSPITLPEGFQIGVYVSGLAGPRMMTVGPDGAVYVAERGANRIVRLADINGDGEADGIEVIADGLNKPDSLAFYSDGSLYVSEPTKVIRFSAPNSDGVFQDREVIISGLPGGGHATRTLLFSPDFSKLFVAVGSSCNICLETDSRRATIMQYDPDGSNGTIYASGLRNVVGMSFKPGTEELWASNNGRDNLGDTNPPETIYAIQQNANYGWPVCHAGRIIDPDFGSSDSCNGVQTPQAELAAHMAPLGITFYAGNQFPQDYQVNLFVALHGSWNSTVPVGYKIMRIPINADGSAGQPIDFATGWLRSDGVVWGRPVGIVELPDGSLLVSDDKGGTLFRIYYKGS